MRTRPDRRGPGLRPVRRFVPRSVRAEILRRRHPGRRLETRQLRAHPAGPGIVVESYWLQSGADEGPALSVRALGDEVWRVDVLSKDPHVHMNTIDTRSAPSPHDARMHFPSTRAGADLDNVMAFVMRNIEAAFALNRRGRIRRLDVDRDALDRALQDATEHMAAMLDESKTGV